MTFLLQFDNGLLDNGVWESVMNAMSHIDNLRQAGGDAWMSLMLMAKAAREYSQTKVGLDNVLKLTCILKINGLQLSTTYGDPIGVFLDPTLVKINHNCDGNVMVHRPIHTNGTGWPHCQSQDKAILKLLPLRNIAAGEEITISYVDFTKSVSERQKILQRDYLFACTCNKCTTEIAIDKELSTTKPDVAKRYATWREEVDTHLQLLKTLPDRMSSSIAALGTATEAMESEPTFSPATDPYPRAIHELKLLHMDNHKSVDAALIYALKEHLLIGSAIYTSSFYPTRIVNAMYLLQVFALLDDSLTRPPDQDLCLVQQARAIEQMGLSRKSMKYWRFRVCTDTRACLLKSGLTDLLGALEMEQMSIGIVDRSMFQEMASGADMRRQGEEEMRKLLGMSEQRWEKLVKPGLESHGNLHPVM